MRLEQCEHTMHARVDAQTVALRVETLERMLIALDHAPDVVAMRDLAETVLDLRARFEREADKETIRLLRRTRA